MTDQRALAGYVALAGLGALTLGGLAAGLAAAAYGLLAIRAVRRRRATQAADQARTRALDGLSAMAADLRAGLPPATEAAALGDARIARLARSAARLAEHTGAPLADLIERIEADARAMDRARASAAAQAAGARATAWLLAGLPLGGIALGYGIGVDPLDVLLHTPVGAGCLAGAVGLQSAGLLWADRLAAPATGAVA